jgi:hypothetical protein
MAEDSRIPKDPSVSRIWNALRQAEKQQRQTPRLEPVGQLQIDRTDHRKSKRSKPHVALLVYGSNADKRPFHEETETLNANEGGCLITLEAPVVRGQRLILVNTGNQDERECRVVRLGKPGPGKRQVAVEFLRPAPEFWFDF